MNPFQFLYIYRCDNKILTSNFADYSGKRRQYVILVHVIFRSACPCFKIPACTTGHEPWTLLVLHQQQFLIKIYFSDTNLKALFYIIEISR